MYLLITLCLLGTAAARQPAAPHHSADHLPDTVFSCRDKVLGGYYADPDAQCQMFHVCVKVAGVGIQDFRFLCPNGTAFDQEAQICAGWADVACEPTALYYSSDNFDLYRIGSGFESKKAPTTFEDEPDFHLQRAEPDIFSGAHSSNFFNNREGKDNQDTSDVGGQRKNQVDNQQRKKVVKKLQRRPTESAPQPTQPQPKPFTNNFAGSYSPTTSRTTSTSTYRTSTLAQNNNNYNNNANANANANVNYNQRSNNYQSFRQQPSTTAASYDANNYYKTEQENKYTQKTEQAIQNSTPTSRFNNRPFRGRQQSTPEYNYNTESKQTTANNNRGTQYYNKEAKSTNDNNNYNAATSSSYYSSQATTPKYNNKEKKPSYENQQYSTKVDYNTEPTYQKQPSSQNNYNNQQYVSSTQQTTPNYNYNSEAYNKQDSTYYNSKSTQQSTPQYNQYNNQQPSTQYNNQQSSTQFNNQQSSAQYNNQQPSTQYYNNDEFEKIKPTAKNVEKKQQYSAKQSTPQYNYNDNQKYSQPIQQTPKPKYNTNLQYDNNQQSTPLYNYNNDQSSQYKNNQASSTQNNQQYSTQAPTTSRGGNYNQQYNQQQYSTSRQQFSSTDYQQPKEQKSTSINYSTESPSSSSSNNRQYDQQRYSTTTYKSSKPEDYDDGQYRPELYEREAGGQYDITVRQNSRIETPTPKTPEPELLKAAHSINIAASGNQFARENKQKSSPVPITTQRNVYTPTSQATYTSTTPRNVYSSFAAVTSAAPRPFSARPVEKSASVPARPVEKSVSVPASAPALAPVAKVSQVKQAAPHQKPIPKAEASKPKSSSKGKDVSYDYAYYDNSDHYSEYENIEEFGRTSKRQ